MTLFYVFRPTHWIHSINQFTGSFEKKTVGQPWSIPDSYLSSLYAGNNKNKNK